MCSHSTSPSKDVDPADHGLILTMIDAGTLPYGRFLIPCAALSLLSPFAAWPGPQTDRRLLMSADPERG